MWNVISSFIKDNWTLLTAIAGLLVFFLYERKKKKLEIEKLTLEVEKLRKESLIYRPSLKEIKEILEETAQISTRKLGIIDRDSVEDLGDALKHFLTHLLAYYGDSDASMRVMRQRHFKRIIRELGMDSEGEITELRFPDPRRVIRLWRERKALAASKLAPRTIQKIDSLLNRFSSGSNDALQIKS